MHNVNAQPVPRVVGRLLLPSTRRGTVVFLLYGCQADGGEAT